MCQPFYFLQKLADSGDINQGRGPLLGERETSTVFGSHITGVTNWKLGGRGRRGAEEMGYKLLEDMWESPTALQYFIEI